MYKKILWNIEVVPDSKKGWGVVILICLPGKMIKVGSFCWDHGTLKEYVCMWYLSKQAEVAYYSRYAVCLLLEICRYAYYSRYAGR
jgi:hypothetical protein